MKREEILFGGLLLAGVVIVIGLAFFLSPDKDRPGVWGDQSPKASFASPQGQPPRAAKRTRRKGDRPEGPRGLKDTDLSHIKDPEKRARVEKLLGGGKWIKVVDGAGGFYYTRPVTLHGLGPKGEPHNFRVSMRPHRLAGGIRLSPQEGASPPR